MTGKRYEPFIDLDRATESVRGRVKPPPMPEQSVPEPSPPVAKPPPAQPAPQARSPMPESDPLASLWARSDPARERAKTGNAGSRQAGTLWLVLTTLAIGASATYLGYAALFAPDTPSVRSVATTGATPRDPVVQPAPQIAAPPPIPLHPNSTAAPSPHSPATSPSPDIPPYPAIPPAQADVPSAWTPTPVVEPPMPAHQTSKKPVRARHGIEHRHAKQPPRQTRHRTSW